MISPPKPSWPRYISGARALLAAAGLLGFYHFLPDSPKALFAAAIVFLIYAVALAVRGPVRNGMLGLLALFVDAIYFLILAGFGNGRLLWLVSIFFLYLLAEALAFYGPVEVGVVAALGIIFCAMAPNLAMRAAEPTVLVAGVLACGCAIERRRLRADGDALREELLEARKTADTAGDIERQRIASDFHDGPLQSFISLQMRLEILRKLLERDFQAGMEDLRQLHALALSQIRDLRGFFHGMLPVDVEGGNLVAAGRRTAEMFQKESGIPVAFSGTSTPVGLPKEMAHEVLQMLREALHNVQKHAGASRVAVAMEKSERGLEISVDDNGHGFGFAGAYTLEELELLRLGPVSLKRRARSLNAEMLLESRPNRGAGLKFRVPLP